MQVGIVNSDFQQFGENVTWWNWAGGVLCNEKILNSHIDYSKVVSTRIEYVSQVTLHRAHEGVVDGEVSVALCCAVRNLNDGHPSVRDGLHIAVCLAFSQYVRHEVDLPLTEARLVLRSQSEVLKQTNRRC